MKWEFKREERSFEQAPIGKHRVRIKSAEMAVSKSGNDMMVLQLNVSGSDSIVFNHTVFMTDKPDITNRMLTALFDSFGIQDGDFNVNGYVGKVGGAMLKQDGEYVRVHYFLSKKEQSDLPEWIEGKQSYFEPVVDEEELPFL